MMADAYAELRQMVRQELARPCHGSADALSAMIRQRHGETVAAILFYGSCLRQDPSDSPPEGIQDFYVVVDCLNEAYQGRWPAFANRLLPPNVFYIERAYQGGTIRAKYAVISRDQWRHGTSERAFHPWLWARFAQPAALLYVRDEQIRGDVDQGVASAITTMLSNVMPLVSEAASVRDLWFLALGQTYRAELRPENADRASLIFDTDRERYQRITPIALQALGDGAVKVSPDGQIATSFTTADRQRTERRWMLRRFWGKPLSVLRLMKSLFTFDGGIDYALWKVERHTGVQVPVSNFERRHPILMSPRLLWRVYRLSAVR